VRCSIIFRVKGALGLERKELALIKSLIHVRVIRCKALHYKLFFVKALAKRLWKLTIKMKRLLQLKLLSFVNVND